MPAYTAENPFIRSGMYNLDDTSSAVDAHGTYSQRILSTPDWIIYADQIFASTIDGDSEYAQSHTCFDVEFSLVHNMQGDITSKTFNTSGVLVTSDVTVYLPTGPYAASLKKLLATATLVKEIHLTKMSIIGGDKVPTRQMIFYNCFLTGYKERSDVIKFSFRYTKFSDSSMPYTQDGQSAGNVGVTVDLQKWTVADA